MIVETESSGREGSLLLVEDNRDIAEMVHDFLESRDFSVDYAADGVTGLHLAVKNTYDLIVLDLMLPGMDGIELCRKLRLEARKDTPVLMLTARDTLDDKVHGLEAGADDYLIKPFEILELEARIKAMLRRTRGEVAPERLVVGDLVLDTATLRVERSGKSIPLTPITLRILTVLMRAAPRLVSRQDLEKAVWGDMLPDSDTLRSHLYTLRKAIDKPFDVSLLQTVPGLGYRMEAEADS